MQEKYISIIIPTYNEQDYLQRTLASIQKQTYKNYEIIVSDSNSTDDTTKIAKTFGAVITEGGTPGKGRNNGVKISRYPFILFLDADTHLPRDFLTNMLSEVEQRKLDAYSCYVKIDSKNIFTKIVWWINNFFINISQYGKKPQVFGATFGIKKSVFNNLDGFDESIRFAEDVDFVRRIVKNGYRFRLLKSTYSITEDRRFRKEGVLSAIIKTLYLVIIRELFGPIRRNIAFRYELGNHKLQNQREKNT